MNSNHFREFVDKILIQMNMTSSQEETHSLDVCLPLLEKMRSEGAVILLKWDGGRGEGDNGPYTAVVSGAPLEGEFFRTDAASMEDALAYVIVNYAQLKWNFKE